MDRSLRGTVVRGWRESSLHQEDQLGQERCASGYRRDPLIRETGCADGQTSDSLWIFCNVPDDSCERLTVSDKVIEILVLPKMAVAAQHEVCFVRGVGFPGVKNR